MSIRHWELAGAEDDRLFSPNCWRVRMALAHKGLIAETVPWRFTEKDAIAFSKQGLVPVIDDDGREVHDSWDIALYLDEAYPDRARLFDGPQAKSLAFFFKHWCERNVHASMIRVIITDLFASLHGKDQAYFRETREKRFGRTIEELGAESRNALPALRGALDPVRPLLAAQRFVSGSSPGFADYILFGPFQWARAVSPVRLLEPDDPMYAWRERMLDLFDGMPRQTRGYPVWA
ncbi:MAG: glutathione S-transferase N-terminal domain-containing protein [Betaproteobacteria bacterium]